MQRNASFNVFFLMLATAGLSTAQIEQKLTVTTALGGPRSLNPGATICVNPPLDMVGTETELSKAGEELAKRIRAAGFAAGVLGTLGNCDVVLFTEITGSSRKSAELDFRMVFSDEQIPRLCASARGKSGKSASWRAAVLAAFADEARQIQNAQLKGMAVYAGAVQ